MKKNYKYRQKQTADSTNSFVLPIMDKFSCNEDMAKIIWKSAQKSGEIELIKRMCGLREEKENGE